MKILESHCKVLLILTLNLLTLSKATSDTASSCPNLTPYLRRAEQIRELPAKHSVPCEIRTREEIEQFVRTTVKDKISPTKLAMEAEIYRTFKIIPRNYDYKEELIKLYVQQIGGYYDPAKKHFVMASWIPVSQQDSVLVHELTHALQDQQIDLNSLLDQKSLTSDELLARSALIEGDATAVMIDDLVKRVGRPSVANMSATEVASMLLSLGISPLSAPIQAPKELSAIMLFPYTAGIMFSHHLLKQGGYAELSKALKQPPRTSREILHPEEYPRAATQSQVNLKSKLSTICTETKGIDCDQLQYDSLGEYFIRTVLEKDVGNSKSAAEMAKGLANDLITVTTKNAEERELVWITEWDTERDGAEFAKGMGIVFGRNGELVRKGNEMTFRVSVEKEGN